MIANTPAQIEGKHTLKPHGRHPPSSSRSSTSPRKTQQQPFVKSLTLLAPLPSPLRTHIYLHILRAASQEKLALTLRHPSTGVTITQSWTTASLLDTKVELADVVAPGAKIDLQNLWNPSKPSSAAQKINLAFKNPNVHSRAFINYGAATGNIDAVVDVVAGHEGFLVGGEAAYDVQKAGITRYGAGVAYATPSYTAALNGVQNMSIIAASYYQKVNSSVEVGARAGYDVQAQKASGLELASKYKLDPLSFAKVRGTIRPAGELRMRVTDVSYRPRSTTAVLRRSLTAPSSTLARPSASVCRSTRRSSTRLATRSARRSLSRVKRVGECVYNEGCTIDAREGKARSRGRWM